MQRIWSAPVIAVLVAAVGLSACDAMIGADSEGEARLRVHMIDAPFPFELVESTNVTISRVEVHSETGGFVTISDETAEYNLLELQDGVFAPLGDVIVEPGTYHSVRLYVDDATIVLKDGTEFDLMVPSDRIKVLVDDLTIDEGEDVTLTIDFDVSRSFVVQGNPDTPAGIKGFLFKPTVVPAGIDRRQNDDDDELEVEGVVEFVHADYIEIGGVQYFVTDDTEFDGGTFDSLEEGMHVEVEYVEADDGTFVATEIEIEEADEDES